MINILYTYGMVNTNSGIYKITNIINNKVYIGSSVNLDKRKNMHFFLLSRNKHHSSHLQHSYNKYGVEQFTFDIMEVVLQYDNESNIEFERRLCKEREQYYLNEYGAKDYVDGINYNFLKNTYNICPIAGSSYGRPVTNVPWNKGRFCSEDQINNLKKAWVKRRIEKPVTDETKKKMSTSMSKKANDPQYKEKRREIYNNSIEIECPHCNLISKNKGNMAYNHFDNCFKNPNLDTEKINLRKQATRDKLKKARENQPILTCPHCEKESRNKGWMTQNHFDKCKIINPYVNSRSEDCKSNMRRAWIKRKLNKIQT